MTGPSPFDIARAIGQNIGQYQQDERESSIIDRILNQAQSGGGYQQAINQLLSSRISPQRQQMALGAIQNLQQQQSAANMFGTDFAGLSPDLQKAYIGEKYKQPAGGLTGQPISPEISNAIEQVIRSNPEASAEELMIEFDKAGVPRTFSNSAIETRRRRDEIEEKRSQSREDIRLKRDERLIQEVDDIRKTIPIKRASTEVMENALLNNNLSYFSLANLAKLPGFEWAETVGGSTFKAAQKNHLISTIGQLTGRPNQWIEQQISEAYAKIGRPQDANLAGMVFTRFETDAINKWVEIIDELEEKGTIAPGKLGRAASKEMEKWYQQEIKKVNKKINDIASGKLRPEELFVPEGKVVMYAPDGGILHVDNNEEQINYYKSLGATQP